MDFEVQGKTEQWLKLEKDGTGVEFLASRLLVEYEIQKEILQVGSKNNISRAHLKFVFRRRMEYHVTNTFLQVFYFIFLKIYVFLIILKKKFKKYFPHFIDPDFSNGWILVLFL